MPPAITSALVFSWRPLFFVEQREGVEVACRGSRPPISTGRLQRRRFREVIDGAHESRDRERLWKDRGETVIVLRPIEVVLVAGTGDDRYPGRVRTRTELAQQHERGLPFSHVQIENDEVRALPVQRDARGLDIRNRAYVMPCPAKDVAQDVPVIRFVFNDKHICHVFYRVFTARA
jgi:hypothetical protein